MKIGIGNDHAGTALKLALAEHLKAKGVEVTDFGVAPGEKADYPDQAVLVADAVLESKVDKGILICGTGIGISIAANKIPGIRAALCSECYSARMAVEHNNANILVLGGRVTGEELAKSIVDTFLAAKFEGGRHQNRLDIISDLEKR